MQVDFDGYTYILLDFPNVITGIKVVFYGLEMWRFLDISLLWL